MENLINEMTLNIKAVSANESFARACIASFCVQAEPTLDEITDLKTAVSEAVTNCVVHAYPHKKGQIIINVKLYNDGVEILISDEGVGIKDINKAIEPFYTSKPSEERSGMGFTVMESFMDKMEVSSNSNGGLSVKLIKFFENKKKVLVGE